jgi:hypothetical protein
MAGLCVAAILALPCSAQTALLLPPTPLLPQHFGSWQAQHPPTTGNDTAEIDSAHAIPLKEDGLTRFATAPYRRGSATLQLKVMQFVDASGASAAFSLYRAADPGLRLLPASEKLGDQAAASNSEVLFRAQSSLVLATAPAAATHVRPADLHALAITLPKISGAKGISPMLPTLLPARDKEAETVRYALGPVTYAATGGTLPPEILGFDKAAEAVTAQYAGPSGRATLTLLLYPTPQLAGIHGRAVESWLNTHNSGLGTVKLRREGPLVLLITGNYPAEEAQRIIENIHLRSEVTWDKKMPAEFHSEVQKTASLLFSIAVFSGLLMVAAVILALFFGVGRAYFRVLRGKPAASEPEFLALGLEHGPVKPIEHPDRQA